MWYEEDHYSRYKVFVEDMMEEQKKEALNAIKTIVSPDYALSLLKVLSSACEYGCPEAEKIADLLCLNQKDFIAIDGKTDLFEDILHKENENRLLAAMEC